MWNADFKTEENHEDLEKDSFYNHYGALPSSMYENLITNLPKALMTFKGFPVKEEYNEFMSQENFLEYLNDYVDNFDLRRYFKFNTFVS
jgi:cation diffusion facilitator CzcD-associated flavoprotein CzcO